jgi:hypothetical protein
VLAKVAIVAIFPHVAAPGIEERVVTPAIRELDVVEDSVRHDGLGLKDWSQSDHRKKQSDSRSAVLRICAQAGSFSVAEPVDRTARVVAFNSPR